MRRIQIAATSALLAFLPAFAAPAVAVDRVYATITCELQTAAPFAGLYRYSIEMNWKNDAPALSVFDAYLDLHAYPAACGATPLDFRAPAGASDGETMGGGACLVSFAGSFLCQADAAIPFSTVGSVAVFTGGVGACRAKAVGNAKLEFFTARPPAPPSRYVGGIALRHDAFLTVGDVFGTLPADPLQQLPAASVVINEFLVLPPAPDSEFIEVFNRSAMAVSLTGWTLEVCRPDVTRTFAFPSGAPLPSGGYFVAGSDFVETCPPCLPAPGDLGDELVPLAGPDILFDPGGVILLRDATGAVVDQVGYGNLGGAAISCPLLVPSSRPHPPGFSGGRLHPEATPLRSIAHPAVNATLATSTSRLPNGEDGDKDALDFNIAPPTPNATNSGLPSDPGSVVRLNRIYAFPVNQDGMPPGEGIEFYNPLQASFDLNLLHVSDGLFIQPLFFDRPLTDPVWLGVGGQFRAFHSINATISFELEADDRMDLIELRPNGLVVVDQLGWSRVPEQFPDACVVRTPDGSGPATGWDWVTSGGDITLFYLQNCGLESASNDAGDRRGLGPRLGSPRPNPARDATEIAFEAPAGARARLSVHDVAGRLCRLLYEGTSAGARQLTWDGRDDEGDRLPPGIYFLRLSLPESAVVSTRTLVRLR